MIIAVITQINLVSVQLIYTTIGNCGTDVFFFGLAMHTCGQFEILRNDLTEFGMIGDGIQLRRSLHILIKRHKHLINLSQQLDDSFNGILLMQLFLSSLVIVVLGIQIIIGVKAGNTLVFLRLLFSFVVLMVQLFLYCYAGDYLSTSNEILVDSIYKCPWYNLTKNLEKDLLFMMMRARVKFYITAGKFYSMDIENFKNVFKASMSYISVLLVMLNLDE
ncbi:odorant receptor 22c-like [Belonocnema kinseyi]|uniref:odorant receptor 22c-like n=1 Tax=Belonocnema kinseyi TaxID=2817044 RepID=UPI00143D0086|nr:odorant receptor 22c-like [Belonocnema kinseyi]